MNIIWNGKERLNDESRNRTGHTFIVAMPGGVERNVLYTTESITSVPDVHVDLNRQLQMTRLYSNLYGELQYAHLKERYLHSREEQLVAGRRIRFEGVYRALGRLQRRVEVADALGRRWHVQTLHVASYQRRPFRFGRLKKKKNRLIAVAEKVVGFLPGRAEKFLNGSALRKGGSINFPLSVIENRRFLFAGGGFSIFGAAYSLTR